MRRVTIINTTASNSIQKEAKVSLLSTTAIIAGVLLISSQVNAQSIPANSWDYDVVLDGNVAKDTSIAGTTDITVTGGNGFVEGNADIYTGHTVNVTGNNDATFAYRDNRNNIESTLNGNLNSNMDVVIIDKNGLFFGDKFNADVQSIIGTSGDVAAADIMDGGDLTIQNINKQRGDITLNGNISIKEAGLAAFVAPNVVNNGVINAKLGRVQLGAAHEATVDLYGDGLIELALSGKVKKALVKNNGRIIAEGGMVQMTAFAAKKTVDNVVNNRGIINASSVSVDGGKIILSGGNKGTVRNTGAISTSNGGSVNISGKRFVQGKAKVKPAPTFTIVPTPKPPEHSGQPYIKTAGGGVNVETSRNVKIKEGYINAQGGNINIDNNGSFYSAHQNTLRTSGTGTIELNQNNSSTHHHFTPTIQNTVDAVYNTGTGRNTINVGAGTYNETVRVDHDNIILNGNNAGKHGRAPSRVAETIIVPDSNSMGVYITADNATVDGFEMVKGLSGVRINGGNNSEIINNVIHDQYHVSAEGSRYGAYAAGDGIFAQNATGTSINRNFLYGMNNDSVTAVDVSNLIVTDNVINNAGDQGIGVTNGTNINVDYNTVVRTGRDAIQLINVDGTSTVNNNIIFHAANSGINLFNVSGDTTVDNNTIAYSSVIGIDVYGNSDGVVIGDTDGKNGSGNNIHHVGWGVKVSTSNDITAEDNIINNVQEGIITNNSNLLNFHDNSISSFGNGIKFVGGMDGRRAFAYGNDIEAANVGILVENGVSNESILNLGTKDRGNTIRAGIDGIRVEGSINQSRVRVTGSDITGGDDGIEFQQVNDGSIALAWYNANIVGQSGSGIKVNSAQSTSNSGLLIVGNINIAGSQDGVTIGNIDGASVAIVDNNSIAGGMNGVNFSGDVVNSASSILIGDDGTDGTDSNITGKTKNGINFANNINNSHVEIGSGSVTVAAASSTIQHPITVTALRGSNISGNENGIHINGDLDGSDITVSKNGNITGNVGDSVSLSNTNVFAITSANIFENNVTNSGRHGIHTENISDLSITDNNVSDSFEHGVLVGGANNGLVTFQGNQLTNNGQFTEHAAARFESGDIDMSNLSNPNIFTNTTGLPTTAMQFDNMSTIPVALQTEIGKVKTAAISGGNGLRIVNETIGTTVFDGYLPEESFYVRFEDGAILDEITGNPIVIDADNVSFDGVTSPFTPSELNFIEDRLYDADDAPIDGRGQIFGISPTPVTAPIENLSNFQDIFRKPQFANNIGSGTNLTITGLPSVNGFSLNNIEPAAGGTEKLANIEPAAGSKTNTQNVTCIADAIGSINNGSVVSYNFGGSFEDSILGASECATISLNL